MFGFGKKQPELSEQVYTIEVTGSGVGTYEVKAQNWLSAGIKVDEYLLAKNINGSRQLKAK